jgi:iron complex outermembrane receptor protein
MLMRQPAPSRARHYAFMFALLGSTTSLLPVTARAADAAPSEREPKALEEVVVTARRVEENMQTVPVAVTAISEAALRQKSITNPTEVMFNAPSVQMTTAFGRLSGGYSIRGLAGGTQAYFAEVAGGPTESSAPFYDIGSVQVLNGPQGTLFGRANTAGAVLVSPNRPVFNRLEGSLDVTEGNLGISRVTAVINVPLIADQLAIRLAVHRHHEDGYTKVLGSSRRLNGDNSENARLSVEWRPGAGKFRNYAVLDYYNVDQSSGAMVLAAINPTLPLYNLPANINAPNGLAVGTATFGAACNAAIASGRESNLAACVDSRLRTAATFRPALQAEYDRIKDGGDAVRSTPGDPTLDQSETLRKYTFVNQTEYDFGEIGGFTTAVFRNIFGFQATTGATGWDVDGVGGLIQSSVSVSSASNYFFTPSANQVGNQAVFSAGPYQKVYTNETQLRGVVGKDRLSWNVGGYYQDTPAIRNLDGIRNLSRVYSGITLPTLGYNPSFPFADGGDTTQAALYGQGTLDIGFLAPFISGLHATGGIRKSWDKSVLNARAALTDIATGHYFPGASSSATTKSNGYNSTISLDGQVTDDLLVYAATRKGYRPGGINQTLNAVGLPNYTPTYAPETVKDVEVGAKYDFRLGEARGRINGAVYRTEYSNIQRQFNASVAGVTTTYVVNASQALIKGAELQAQLVFGNWDLSANYAYSDPKFTKWVGSDPLALIKPGNPLCVAGSTSGICLIDLTDNPFPNISKHQASFTARYDIPLADDLGRVSVSGTAYIQSRRYFSDAAERNVQAFGEAVRDAISQKAFSRFNLRADWNHVQGTDFSLSAFVNNVTDVNYKLTTVTQLHSLGTAVALYGEPRTFGVELRYEFGS